MDCRKSTFSLFQARVDISPLGISEISELINDGADIKKEAHEVDLFFTIVSKANQYTGSRIIALRFASRDLRNTTVTSLRRLVGDLQVTLSTKSNNAGAAAKPFAGAAAVNPAINPMAKQRNASITNASGTMNNATGDLSGTNPMGRPMGASTAAPARRLSVREVAQEEKQKAAEVVANFRRPSNLATPDNVVSSVSNSRRLSMMYLDLDCYSGGACQDGQQFQEAAGCREG